MRRIVLYFFLLGILSLTACTEDKSSKPSVLSSIKPVHAIVVAIAGEHVAAHQLIPDSASPHNYAFKPSDLKKISKADLIFRIDEHFEVMLNAVFSNLPNQKKILSLAENPAIHLLPLVGKHAHDEKKGGDHESTDMHIFTSPENALAMAKVITDALSELDPENAQAFQTNLEKFTEKVTQASNKIKADLALLKDKPYVVFHPSWQYFAEYFGLQKPTVVDLQEGVTAGGKTIKKIKGEIRAKRIQCIFKESSVSQARVNVLTEGMDDLHIKSVEIDVLGRQITISQNAYTQWLETMGNQVKNCLK